MWVPLGVTMPLSGVAKPERGERAVVALSTDWDWDMMVVVEKELEKEKNGAYKTSHTRVTNRPP
jgi:hypothetical protein